MHIEEKEIDGVKYVPAKVFWDVWKDWQEDIEETKAETKEFDAKDFNIETSIDAFIIKKMMESVAKEKKKQKAAGNSMIDLPMKGE